jgi:hypothetical protein
VVAAFAAADDGKTVYFVADGPLAPGATRGRCGQTPNLNHCNLYVWTEDGGVRFIAALDSPGVEMGDYGNWSTVLHDHDSPGSYASAYRTSRATPDGRFLLFSSQARLTGYDNAGHRQLYLYDAEDGQLRCVSCNPRAAASSSDAELKPTKSVEGASPLQLSRNLSEDGRRVFFNTVEALVPGDVNGKRDVYLWQEGALRLISSGQGAAASTFVEASPSGDDAFFTTSQQLVGSDVDQLFDLYDARVGGGFAQQQVPPDCLGDACQGAPSAPAPAPRPGSSAFDAGRAAPAHSCRKSQRLKRGRCVARKQRKHKKQKRRSHQQHRQVRTTGRLGK